MRSRRAPFFSTSWDFSFRRTIPFSSLRSEFFFLWDWHREAHASPLSLWETCGLFSLSFSINVEIYLFIHQKLGLCRQTQRQINPFPTLVPPEDFLILLLCPYPPFPPPPLLRRNPLPCPFPSPPHKKRSPLAPSPSGSFPSKRFEASSNREEENFFFFLPQDVFSPFLVVSHKDDVSLPSSLSFENCPPSFPDGWTPHHERWLLS